MLSEFGYSRHGTPFFRQPHRWREVSVRKAKTSLDWAEKIRTLLDEDYPDAERVILVCDNLNTHKIGSPYEASPPEEAHRLASRLETHFTPKHGSSLNVAEIELSIITRQCLDRRVPDQDTLKTETTAWQNERNENQKGVDWRFTTDEARIKIKRLYPQTQR